MSRTEQPTSLVDHARILFEVAVRRVQADQLMDASPSDEWTVRSLEAYRRVRVVGMGKAAMAMAGVLEARHPGMVDEGIVVVPEGYPDAYPQRLPAPQTAHVVEGGHPLPSSDGVRAARRMLEHAEAGAEGDGLLVLVSGGGTALSTLPADALDLADLKTTYHLLLEAGVPIHGANAVRKHLTQVGGGQLARAAQPAHVGALVVSDVPGDDLSVVASGPTVPDPSTYEDAIRVLYRHQLWHDVPGPVREHLIEGAEGNRAETPAEEHPCFETVRTTLMGTNGQALAAARAAAEERGFDVRAVEQNVEGEARDVGRKHVRTMLRAPLDGPACWLWGGETTVTVTGTGTGGRNQEVALGAALGLDGAERRAVLLSGGTDGIDGPTPAAGAWATPATAEEARAAGCEPTTHLKNNNAYPLFDTLDQLLRTGPTHTNVMDVHVGVVWPE